MYPFEKPTRTELEQAVVYLLKRKGKHTQLEVSKQLFNGFYYTSPVFMQTVLKHLVKEGQIKPLANGYYEHFSDKPVDTTNNTQNALF